MSEYELSLLRQRGIAARDSKAKRGELRYELPPGYCWDELGRVVLDVDERVVEAVRLVFRKFRELGSARQVMLWARESELELPVIHQSRAGRRIGWHYPAYHNVVSMLKHPLYAGAYVFGRTTNRTKVIEGRARKSTGHKKPMQAWSVLLKDHHPGYISWTEFEANQQTLSENAHMQKRTARKGARGGRALLTGLARCGRCARMMRLFYGSQASHAHRYQCIGEYMGNGVCLGIGGVRVDQAIARAILEVVSDHAVKAAILAEERFAHAQHDIREALERELEEAQYEASLASRRYEAVDPAKRLVARELESRWNAALERVAQLQERLATLQAGLAQRRPIDRAALLALAQDLPAVWNAPTTDTRTKQRIVRILVLEVLIDLDNAADEVVLTIHWIGGRHTEVRIPRVKTGRYPIDRHPSPVVVMRKLGGKWPDKELATTMNRMRCKHPSGGAWTTMRVRELRERLKIAPFDPNAAGEETITVDETARRLKICVGSVYRLIREGSLPAVQLMPSAPWQIPVAALDSQSVKTGLQGVAERRSRKVADYQAERVLKLPGF
jgi:excisionase family DNA binding protein